MNFETSVIVSFQITIMTIIMVYTLIYSRTSSYFNCFIIFILAIYLFPFRYSLIVVKFVGSVAFHGVALIRGRHLLENGDYFDMRVNDAALIKGLCLFETRCYDYYYYCCCCCCCCCYYLFI